MKTAGRIALRVVAIAAVLIGGVLLYLASGPGEDYLRGVAESKLGGALDARVGIGRLETDLFGRIVVEQVTIAPASDTSSIPEISVDRLRIRYSLFTLLFDGLEVDSVILEGGRIDFLSDSTAVAGSAGARRAPGAPDTSTPPLFGDDGGLNLPVRIGHADLSGLTFVYRDRSVPLSVTGSGIRVTGEMDDRSGGLFRIEADSTRIEGLDAPIAVAGVLLAGSINTRAVGGTVVPATVDTFRASAAGMAVAGRFDVRPDSIDGSVSVTGDPAGLAEAFSKGLGEDLGGEKLTADVAFSIDDPFGGAALRWSVAVPSYAVAGVPVTDFRCDGSLRGDTLTVSGLSFGACRGTVAGSGWMVVDSLLPHSFDLQAKGVRVSDAWKPRTKPGRFSRIPVTVDARVGTGGNLSSPREIEARSTMTITTGRSLVAAPAVAYSRGRVTVRSSRGMAHIDAELDLHKQGWDGTVGLSVPSLAALAPVVDLRGLDGSLELSAEVGGKGDAVRVAADATSDGISFNGVDLVDDLSGRVRLQDDEVVIDSASITGWAVDLGELADVLGYGEPNRARGEEDDDPGDVGRGDADSTTAGPGPAGEGAAGTEGAGIAGTLAYTLNVRGRASNPSAELTAEIERPAYGRFAFDGGALRATLADSVVTLDRLTLEKDSSVVTVTGGADLRDLAGSALVAFGPGIPGESGTGEPDTIGAVFAYADSANYSLRASTRHLAVGSIRPFVPGIPVDGGQLDFALDLRSSGGRLTAGLPFALTGLSLRKGTIDSIAGALRYDDGAVALDSLRISNEGRRLRADATLELLRGPDGSRSFGWECRTRGSIAGDTIHLTRILPFLSAPVEIGGAVDLDLRWDGVVKRPKFRGTIGLSDVRYGPQPKSPWFTGLGGQIRLGEGTLRSDSLTAMLGKMPVRIAAGFERGDSTDFTASLDVSTDSVRLLSSRAAFTGDSIDVLVESRDLDLAALQPFAETLKKLQGRLSTRLTVNGPLADPAVEGNLLASGVSFEPGTSGVPLTRGTVSARLDGARLVVDSVAAEVGGGRILASGTASVDSGGLRDLDFGLAASGIRITKKNMVQLNVKSTDLKLKSAGERYALTGRVEFGETRIVRDIEIADIAKMMAPETDVLEEPKKAEPLDLMATMKEQVAEPGHTPEFLKKIDFDVELLNADGLWVDNNLAKFRTNHDLRLEGNFEKASLTGRIDVRDRGELIFLDRRFEILNGVIDCSDPRRLNPVINLTATCDVTESSGSSARPTRYTITLTVSGPLDEFDYALTSKPSLEQSDIFSLLALGMTQYQLEAGGNKDAVYKDRSEVLASQQISNSVNRFFDNFLGDLLALDHIGIGGNLFDPNQTRFEVTKRWSDRVEIRYSTSITNVDEQILSAEYKINEFLYLEGKTDQMEDSGADLKFRIWFK